MKNRAIIANALEAALSKEGGRVVLLTGPWGSGKTHLWQGGIRPRLTGANPITISLFGTQSVDDIKSRLLGASIWQHRVPLLTKGRFREAVDNMRNLVAAGSRIAADVALGSELASRHIDLLDLLPDNMVICLDDGERTSPDLELEVILGTASFLAERKRARVLLIMNETYLLEEGGSSANVLKRFKERVFDQTFVVQPDIPAIAHDIASQRADMSAEVRLHVPEIAAMLARANSRNVRTLNRVFDRLVQVARQAPEGCTLSYPQTLLITALSLEQADGRLQPEGFYRFSPSYLRFARERELTGDDAQQLAFYRRYYDENAGPEYDFVPQIYELITTGCVEPTELREALWPRNATNDSAAAALIEESDFHALHLMSDEQLAELCQRIERFLLSESECSAFEVFTLAIRLRHSCEVLARTLENPVEESIRKRVVTAAQHGDRSFDHNKRLTLSGMRAHWSADGDAYDLAASLRNESAATSALQQAVLQTSSDQLRRLVADSPSNLNLVFSAGICRTIDEKRSVDAQFHYLSWRAILYALEQQPESSSKQGRFDALAHIQALLATPGLQRTERRRLEFLTKEYASFEQEGLTRSCA